jgi:hypothetical protein
MNCLEDEQVQRRGIVSVSHTVGDNRMGFKPDWVKKAQVLDKAFPWRMSAAHFLFDDPRMRPMMALAHIAMNRRNRFRFRAHFGKYAYGIAYSFCRPVYAHSRAAFRKALI